MSKKSLSLLTATSTLFILLCALPAMADCQAPAAQGIKICFPTEGSTVMYAAAIEMSANTGSASIVKSAVYDNGKLVDTNPFLPGTLVDGAVKNGTHRITVKAWDSNGTVHQASRTFRVTGYGVDFCSTPAAPGVNLCWPQEGTAQPNTSVPISATARGKKSKITSLSVYLDGKLFTSTGDNNILTGAGLSAGRHRVAVIAHDAAGNTFKTAHYFTAYNNYDCNPKSDACSPGVILKNPQDTDVPASFRFDADVSGNPEPTTMMKVYLDGAVVATSTGPGITKQLNLQPGTTHIVWVRAWDTKGNTYATYQTFYVQ